MHITLVVGVRPNFIKIAPLVKEILKAKSKGVKINYQLVHTGQHFDSSMSDSFFYQLNIPQPSVNLNCGGGTQIEQTAKIMLSLENHLISNPTDLLIVVGDVTSTFASAITAQKMNIKVAHVEGGLRSNDWSMPEEINRRATDSISNYFFTTSENANQNLRKEGVADDRIFFVGNTMIDTLIMHKNSFIKPNSWDVLNLKRKDYFILTLHRLSNISKLSYVEKLLEILSEDFNQYKVIFPMHPHTKKLIKIDHYKSSNIHIIEPCSYLNFHFLTMNSLAIITDSGGLSEEATVLEIPCITLRKNTERPETCSIGTNELLGDDLESLVNLKTLLNKIISRKWKKGNIPELWDGKSSERIVNKIIEILNP